MPYSSPIPQLGLGTFGRTGDAGTEALLTAIEIGYRHIDTAQSYDSEGPVGEAIRRSGLPRAEFFITTKVADTNLDRAHFSPSVRRSLDTIGVDQVDLLLIHWPNDDVPFEDYMLALVDAQTDGQARHIGVSNFPIALLNRTQVLLGENAIATNQVEIHAYHQAPRLRDYARSIGLPLTAYQPLVKGQVGADPVLRAIAERQQTTAAAAALAFLMAEGHAVIPASSSAANLRANFAATRVRLGEADMARIRALDRGDRRIDPDKSPRWDD